MLSPLLRDLAIDLAIDLIRAECASDRVFDDVTTRLLGERADQPAEAFVYSREEGVFAGGNVALAFSQAFPGQVSVRVEAREGDRIEPGRRLVELRGTVGTCLTLERTLLNLMSHLCGVASLTRRYVDAVTSFGTIILATRKTLPGLRDLQLQAVEAGGGRVHRRSLSDGILIKDNHLEWLTNREILSRAAKAHSPLQRIEIEVQSLSALDEVLESPPDVIMLDNLPLEALREAVARIVAATGGRSRIEVSGGVKLEQVAAIAALGVDYISVGALTHSVKALDLTMDIAAAR